MPGSRLGLNLTAALTARVCGILGSRSARPADPDPLARIIGVTPRKPIVGAAANTEIYQFKVTLIGVTPPIWRRIHVAGTYTLAQFHRVLQVAMGWENYHLYMFHVGSKRYGPAGIDDDYELGLLDAKRIDLAAALPRVGTTLLYTYDYGDDWEHELLLEAIVMPALDMTYPRLIADERRCPPEDVGGIGGYADYLETMADPSHRQHEEMMMWRGPFDPEEFSVERVNREFANKFRSKPRAGRSRAVKAKSKLSANRNRLMTTSIRPVVPQRPENADKADETVPLELNRRECDLIISHTFAHDGLTGRLQTVPRSGRTVFHFTLDELDELAGEVAAEANHAKNEALQNQLDQLCERIEAVLTKYTDPA
jgi:hypothetical protein